MSASERENVYGGFDYQFVDEAGDEFMCSICHKVLREPHLTECCGQHFCRSCLYHWSRRNVTCPQCRKHSYKHMLDKNVERKVNSLHVLCVHSMDGCPWRGELGDLKEHLHSERGCGYVEVACSNNCGVPQRRKDVQQHMKKTCPLRTYQCEHCGTRGKYKDITTQHYAKCSKYPLRCPKGCPAVVKRADLEFHKNDCPLEIVTCPYSSYVGCDAAILRKELDDHLTKHSKQHIGEMSAKLVTYERDAKRLHWELDARVRKISATVEQIKIRIDETNARVDKANARMEKGVEELMCLIFGGAGCLLVIIIFLFVPLYVKLYKAGSSGIQEEL